MLELTTKHRLSADEAADIKRALLDSARISVNEPYWLAKSLIESFELVDRSTAEPIPSVR